MATNLNQGAWQGLVGGATNLNQGAWQGGAAGATITGTSGLTLPSVALASTGTLVKEVITGTSGMTLPAVTLAATGAIAVSAVNQVVGSIICTADENWSSTASGTRLGLYTVENTTLTRTERFRVDGLGNISVFSGSLRLLGDNFNLNLGAGSDAGIMYDGTNMVYNSALVGSGFHQFLNASAAVIAELKNNGTNHAVLNIACTHNTAHDPQIRFLTDNPSTVKWSLGVDATDDDFILNYAGDVSGAAPNFEMTSTGLLGLGKKPTVKIDTTAAGGVGVALTWVFFPS